MSEHEKALKAGVALLERATTYALGSLCLVTPAILGRPTPCTGWTLHDLLLHLSDSLQTLAEAAAPACTAAGSTARPAETATVSPAPPMDDTKAIGLQPQMTKKPKPTVIAAPRNPTQQNTPRSAAAQQNEPHSLTAQQERRTPTPWDGLRNPAAQDRPGGPASPGGSRDGSARQGWRDPTPQGEVRHWAAGSELPTSDPQDELRSPAVEDGCCGSVVAGGSHEGSARQGWRDPTAGGEVRHLAAQPEPPSSDLQDELRNPAVRDGLRGSVVPGEFRDASARQGRCDPTAQGEPHRQGRCDPTPQGEVRHPAAQPDPPSPVPQDGLRDPVAPGPATPASQRELRNLHPQHDELRGQAPQDGMRGSASHRGVRNLALLLRDSVTEVLGRWVALAGDDLVAVGDRHLTRPMVAAVGAIEVAVHGWDVAVSCGERRPLPPLLAEELLDLARLFVTAEERFVRFAPPLAVPPHAPAHDHLLAFLGRDPAWTPFR